MDLAKAYLRTGNAFCALHSFQRAQHLFSRCEGSIHSRFISERLRELEVDIIVDKLFMHEEGEQKRREREREKEKKGM
jgi:hypothetical protein